jgi:hypothetical protein
MIRTQNPNKNSNNSNVPKTILIIARTMVLPPAEYERICALPGGWVEVKKITTQEVITRPAIALLRDPP